MNFYKLAGACVLALGLTSGANAATFEVFGSSCALGGDGVSCGVPERTDPTTAFDGDTDTFFSLGYGKSDTTGLGGYLLLKVNPGFTGDTAVIETTKVDRNSWQEFANVYVGTSSDIAKLMGAGPVAELTNVSASTEFSVGVSVFTYLLLVDTTFQKTGHTGDGFDVAEIRVTEADANQPPVVPLPAAALLLGSAMGAFGLVRRRKRAA